MSKKMKTKLTENYKRFFGDDSLLEIDEEDSLVFYDADGWNTEELDDLLYVLNTAAKIEYEIKNGRRGSYAISGENIEDLLDDLTELKEELEAVINRIDSQL